MLHCNTSNWLEATPFLNKILISGGVNSFTELCRNGPSSCDWMCFQKDLRSHNSDWKGFASSAGKTRKVAIVLRDVLRALPTRPEKLQLQLNLSKFRTLPERSERIRLLWTLTSHRDHPHHDVGQAGDPRYRHHKGHWVRLVPSARAATVGNRHEEQRVHWNHGHPEDPLQERVGNLPRRLVFFSWNKED